MVKCVLIEQLLRPFFNRWHLLRKQVDQGPKSSDFKEKILLDEITPSKVTMTVLQEKTVGGFVQQILRCIHM